MIPWSRPQQYKAEQQVTNYFQETLITPATKNCCSVHPNDKQEQWGECSL